MFSLCLLECLPVALVAKHTLYDGVGHDSIVSRHWSLQRPSVARGLDGVIQRVEVVHHVHLVVRKHLQVKNVTHGHNNTLGAGRASDAEDSDLRQAACTS